MDLIAEMTRLLAGLDAEGIDYALCGAIALAIHGVPRATQDIDLLARPEDLERVRAVARAAGFLFDALPMTFSATGITIVRMTKIIEQQSLMLGVLLVEGALAKVWEGRQTVTWREGVVRVVSREGLITLKLAAARPQDLVDVQRLEEVRRG